MTLFLIRGLILSLLLPHALAHSKLIQPSQEHLVGMIQRVVQRKKAGKPAFDLMEQVLEVYPNYVPALSELGEFLLMRHGSAGEATPLALKGAKFLQTSFGLEPDCVEARLLSLGVNALQGPGADLGLGRTLSSSEESNPSMAAKDRSQTKTISSAISALRSMREACPAQVFPQQLEPFLTDQQMESSAENALKLGYFFSISFGAKNFWKSKFWLAIGAAGKLEKGLTSASAEAQSEGLCWRLYGLLSVDPLGMRSEVEEAQFLRILELELDILLQPDDGDPLIRLKEKTVRAKCFPNVMHLAYFKTLERKRILEKMQQVFVRALPDLRYSSLEKKAEISVFDTFVRSTTKLANNGGQAPPQLRVGIVSSFWNKGSSIFGSFGPTLLRLPPKLFKLVIIHFPREEGATNKRKILPPEMRNSESFEEIFLVTPPELKGQMVKDQPGALPAYVKQMRQQIEAANVDILLYLDLYMTGNMAMLANSRLAAVQAVTHGHPITSGIDRNVMDFFLSWEGAERQDTDFFKKKDSTIPKKEFLLPDFTSKDFERAQEQYSEKLLLLPQRTAWEWYEPRSQDETSLHWVQSEQASKDPILRAREANWGAHSRQDILLHLESNIFSGDGKGFAKLFDNPEFTIDILEKKRWYFCPQVGFKIHADFDSVLRDILQKDPEALLIFADYRVTQSAYAQGESDSMFEGFKERLFGKIMETSSEEDLRKQILWVPKMVHPILMGVHNLADVVLDTAWFGGDTTTREALETGAPVITINSPYALGGRWTAAYYGVMFDESSEESALESESDIQVVGYEDLVASEVSKYASLAVKQASKSPEKKKKVRERIKKLAQQKLFRQKSAVKEWAKALYRMVDFEGSDANRVVEEFEVPEKSAIEEVYSTKEEL